MTVGGPFLKLHFAHNLGFDPGHRRVGLGRLLEGTLGVDKRF